MFGINSKEEDIYKLLRLIKRKKYSFLLSGAIALAVALIVGFSIPKLYETKVVLAPETAKSPSLGTFASLASFAGIDMSNLNQDDAIYPELYPQIVASTAFIEELYSMNVTSKDGSINTTLYQYMLSHQKHPWWNFILELPTTVKSWFVEKERLVPSGEATGETLPYVVYSEEQTSVMNKLKKMVLCTVDVGNDVVTINVQMQDPFISAQVAGRVSELLKQKVSEYRTTKSVKDYEYINNLYEEAKNDYYEKQSIFANYLDQNALGVAMAKYRKDGDRLEDEMNLAYTIYCQLAQQKEIAKAKVQETTPVFTVLQPACVPLLSCSPNKTFIAISFIILTWATHILWIIMKQRKKRILKSNKTEK